MARRHRNSLKEESKGCHMDMDWQSSGGATFLQEFDAKKSLTELSLWITAPKSPSQGVLVTHVNVPFSVCNLPSFQPQQNLLALISSS